MDDGDGLFHLHTLRIAVPDPYTAFVLRMSLVVGIQTATVGIFEVLVLLLCRQAVEGKLDMSQIIRIGTIDALDGGIGRIGTALTITRILIDTHDLKGKVAHLDVLTYQRLVVLGLQFFGLLVVQHNHLTLLLLVNLVNEASIKQFLLHDLRVNGGHTVDL